MEQNEKMVGLLKSFFKSWTLYIVLLLIGLLIGANLYLKSQIRIEAPKVDLGKKVVVILDNGEEMHTYENLIVKKEKKTYYKGELNTIDVSDGIVVYKDWE